MTSSSAMAFLFPTGACFLSTEEQSGVAHDSVLCLL